MVPMVKTHMLSQRSRYGDIVKPAIKLTIALILMGVVGSVTLNILETIPRSSLMITTLVNMGIGFIAILVVLYFGTELSIAVKRSFKSYPELFTISYSLVQLLAVWIAYASFNGIFNLMLPEWSWAYSATFLALALLPAIRASITLINSVDKWIDHNHRQVS